MTRYVALLRAINVGGHNVKMDALRALFEDLGFSAVETHLASGNVLFTSHTQVRIALQQRIEIALERALGYAVSSFLREPAQMQSVARLATQIQARPGIVAMNVGFLHEPLDDSGLKLVRACHSALDDFEVSGAEIYWACATRQSESKFQPGALERALKRPITFRGVNTVVQLAQRLNPAGL